MILDVGDYVGLPFIDGGRDLDGADCWGLVCLVYKRLLNIDLPEYHISAFDTQEVVDAMGSGRDNDGWEKVNGDRQNGDLVALAMHPSYPDMINHVGIHIGRGSFLHTQKNTGAIISPMNHVLYSKRIKGVYRWVI